MDLLTYQKLATVQSMLREVNPTIPDMFNGTEIEKYTNTLEIRCRLAACKLLTDELKNLTFLNKE